MRAASLAGEGRQQRAWRRGLHAKPAGACGVHGRTSAAGAALEKPRIAGGHILKGSPSICSSLTPHHDHPVAYKF